MPMCNAASHRTADILQASVEKQATHTEGLGGRQSASAQEDTVLTPNAMWLPTPLLEDGNPVSDWVLAVFCRSWPFRSRRCWAGS